MPNSDVLTRIREEKLIHESIMDIIFKKDEDGTFLDYYFRGFVLIETAHAICLYSAILAQAYCFGKALKEGKTLYEISNQKLVPEQIIKFWRGGSELQFGEAISVLIGMAQSIDGYVVDNKGVEILQGWSNIFSRWYSNTRTDKTFFKHKDELNELFITLIKSLKILQTTSLEAQSHRLHFRDTGNDTISIDCSPFIHFYSETYSNDSGNYNISGTYIPASCTITENINYAIVKFFDPYCGHEDMIDFPIFFSQRHETYEAERAIFRMAGLQFSENKIEYEGNFRFIDSFIKATVASFMQLNGDNFKDLDNEYKEEVFKDFLKAINAKHDYDQRILDVNDLENVLWICAIQVGILEFAKKVIGKFGDINIIINLIKCSTEYNHKKEKDQYIKKQIEKYKKDKEKYVREQAKKLTKKFPESTQYFKDRVESINKEAEAIFVLKAAGLDAKDAITDYEKITSIDDYINIINNIEPGQCGQKMEGIYKFLICFYTGINQYYKCLECKKRKNPTLKCEENDIGEAKNNELTFCYFSKRIKKFQELDMKLDEVMIEVASKTYIRIKNYPLGTLHDEFRALLEDMNQLPYLKKYFGRKSICNIHSLDKFQTLINFRNRYLHDASKPAPEGSQLKQQVLDWLKFLKTGTVPQNKSSKDLGDHTFDNTTLCIYPQVISFKESIIKRNSISVIGFETIEDVHESRNNNPQRSKYILTNQRVTQFKEYYCIPHAQRTTDEWLIEPFLIDCEEFDRKVFAVNTTTNEEIK